MTVEDVIIIIQYYCVHCQDTYLHIFRRDEGVNEVYECTNCKGENRVAVR